MAAWGDERIGAEIRRAADSLVVVDGLDAIRDKLAARPAQANQYTPEAELRPCGTVAAYRRHQLRAEPIDAACLAAFYAARVDHPSRARGSGRWARESHAYDDGPDEL